MNGPLSSSRIHSNFLSYGPTNFLRQRPPLYDILILGAGISGLSAAIKAAEHGHSVLILTKGAKPDGSSNYAQGGICAVTDPKDSFKLHIEDTCEAGAGLCKKDAVKILVENGPKTIAQLVKWGVNFTPAEPAEANLHFDLHLEGGHSHKRILHAADLTGKEMMRALIAKLHEFPQITFLENCLIEDLVVKGTGAARRCLGAKVIHQTTGRTEAIFAKATILATGGAGRLWLHTIDPPDACGDGIAIAARAGAAIQDVEFMQFHPTSLYAPKLKKAFLISEAVRGFGGILKNAKGEEFMNGVHPLRSLAPRDIVARAIHREMERTGQPSMFLDVTGRKPKDIRTHFPNIYAKCLSVGIDMTKDWIPVVPAAHYMCGGVLVDTWSRTEIKGLYASGEVAATGVHRAENRGGKSRDDGRRTLETPFPRNEKNHVGKVRHRPLRRRAQRRTRGTPGIQSRSGNRDEKERAEDSGAPRVPQRRRKQHPRRQERPRAQGIPRAPVHSGLPGNLREDRTPQFLFHAAVRKELSRRSFIRKSDGSTAGFFF